MSEVEGGRREHVLRAALATFARYGFRKTSMDDVARAADISRPGLYFLFATKQQLFREAVVHALDSDLADAADLLADTGRPLRDRVIGALDRWAGRYVGTIAAEVPVLVDTHPDLLGPLVADYPGRFVALLTRAVADALPAAPAHDVAATLHSTAAGIKHEVGTREAFLARITVAVDLILR